ncbi:MAG: hypothetical protein ACYCXN_11800 [Acidimicrobiales bacterium]
MGSLAGRSRWVQYRANSPVPRYSGNFDRAGVGLVVAGGEVLAYRHLVGRREEPGEGHQAPRLVHVVEVRPERAGRTVPSGPAGRCFGAKARA